MRRKLGAFGHALKTVACIASLAVCLVPLTASADSYSWGGSSGRFAVDVFVLGFNERAGTGTWNESSARDFASWAARFNAILPASTSVSLKRGVDDDTTTLTIVDRKRTEVVSMPGGPDLAAALTIVAHHSGTPNLPPAAAVKLYTLQLFASRSEERARRFASDLDERGVEPIGQVFYERCHPCIAHPSRVLEVGADGWHRVVAGIYDRAGVAQHALVRLRIASKLGGFVREL